MNVLRDRIDIEKANSGDFIDAHRARTCTSQIEKTQSVDRVVVPLNFEQRFGGYRSNVSWAGRHSFRVACLTSPRRGTAGLVASVFVVFDLFPVLFEVEMRTIVIVMALVAASETVGLFKSHADK